MASAIAVAVLAVVAYWVYSNIAGLRKNIAAAKASGLPYYVSPINIYNPLWLVTHRLYLPLLNRLPKAWTETWLPYCLPDWVWTLQFEPFQKRGDVFLTVSPSAIHVWLANAEAIRQVAAGREAFPKALESYRILDIFGRSLLSTEGAEWKSHRKVTSPGFNEKNNALVFAESCRQAQGMLMKWTGGDGSKNSRVEEVPTDTMRLTLHIISRVGFGVRLLWPGEEPTDAENDRNAAYGSHEPPEGHTMNFEHALESLLENLIWVLLTPKWLLKRLPFKSAGVAYESFINWSQFMNELFQQKIEEAHQGIQTEGMDIMGSLVRSAYSESKVNGGRKSSPGQAENGEAVKRVLSDSDILGNAFVMIVAGHETTANSIHFALMELAIDLKSQRLVQKEVQSVFGNTPPEKWDYDSSINALLGGMVGAVMNEQLRLMPPVIAIPKMVSKERDQTIVLDGKRVTLPAGSHIALDTIGVQRNPKYWPTQPSKVSSRSHDLYDFKPERWIVKTAPDNAQGADRATESEDEDGFEGFTGQDSSAELFRPVRGSYIPFSEGARSCLGRRLAQVEIMAVLAVIFQTYSIELAVDEWATDDEVTKMNDDEKRALYQRAREKAMATLRSATTILTLKLHEAPGFVPVRVVKRGEQRFLNIVD